MRNALASLRAGTARRINKPGLFSRIHVDDIARILFAILHSDIGTRNFSVCDDEPAPPADIVAYAADLLGIEPPRVQNFEDADLSEMARSFYAENKRIRNDRIKRTGRCTCIPNLSGRADRLIQKWRVLASCFFQKALRSVG